MKLWRIAVLLLIPAGLMKLGQTLLATYYSPFRLTLRSSVQRAVSRGRQQVALEHMLDSLRRKSGRTERIGSVVLVSADDSIGHNLENVRAELRDEQASLPASGSSPYASVVLRSTSRGQYWNDVVIAGDWRPCVVLPVADIGTRGPQGAWPHLLGQCAFAAFGPPGGAVGGWLGQVRTYRPGAPSLGSSRIGRTGPYVLDVGKELPFFQSWDEQGMSAFGCRAGDATACRYLILRSWDSVFRGQLLWWLRGKVGNAAFARFWSGNGDVESAATAAFGRPLSSFATEYLRQDLVIINNGPQPPASWPIAAGVTTVLLLGVALGLGRIRVAA